MTIPSKIEDVKIVRSPDKLSAVVSWTRDANATQYLIHSGVLSNGIDSVLVKTLDDNAVYSTQLTVLDSLDDSSLLAVKVAGTNVDGTGTFSDIVTVF